MNLDKKKFKGIIINDDILQFPNGIQESRIKMLAISKNRRTDKLRE